MFLHGSLLHILFNMVIMRRYLPMVADLFGNVRAFVIFMAAGIAGYVLSNALGGHNTIGASGAIFGLLGALISYGRRTGQSQVTGQLWMSALMMFVMSFLMGGHVNNWAHAGGFGGGFLAAQLMPTTHRREGPGLLLLAGALAFVTVAGFVLSFLGFAPAHGPLMPTHEPACRPPKSSAARGRGRPTRSTCEYHDAEWGVPEHDDRALFEKLILDGAQAGLSWETILNKRENYRRAFDGFVPETVARYGRAQGGVAAWPTPASCATAPRSTSAIGNARAFLETAASARAASTAGCGRTWTARRCVNRWRALREIPPETPVSQRDLEGAQAAAVSASWARRSSTRGCRRSAW